MIRVTVYVLNFNYAQFLDQCVTSILSQTFQDFELIIIDDGSTDDSASVIQKFAEDPKVRIRIQDNVGLTSSCNIALAMASGEYIVRVDGDDYLHPKAIESMVAALDANPQACLVFPDYFEVDINGEVITEVRRGHSSESLTLKDQPAHGACTMFRSNVLRSIGGYDESLSRQDGYDIWLRLVDNYEVFNLPESLFYYRQHSTSLSSDELKLLDVRSQIFSKHLPLARHLNICGIIALRSKIIDGFHSPWNSLGDDSLVDLKLEQALSTQSISKVFVLFTSDLTKEVPHSRFAEDERVAWVERSTSLSEPNSNLRKALISALGETLLRSFDLLCILNIEAPFLRACYIDSAISYLQLYKEANSVVSVRLDRGIFMRHEGGGLINIDRDKALRLERNQLYRKTGGLNVVWADYFLNADGVFGGVVGHVIVDQLSGFQIETTLDFQIANLLSSQEKGMNP